MNMHDIVESGSMGRVAYARIAPNEDLVLGVEKLCLAEGFRNAFVRGVDLPALIGQQFEVQGVRFEGVEESRPCHWMNAALGPGAEEWLRGRAGLRGGCSFTRGISLLIACRPPMS